MLGTAEDFRRMTSSSTAFPTSGIGHEAELRLFINTFFE